MGSYLTILLYEGIICWQMVLVGYIKGDIQVNI